MTAIGRHLVHHGRFYASALLGAIVYAAMAFAGLPMPAAAAGDAFFLVYLAVSARMVLGSSADDLRSCAQLEDEGILIVVVIAVAAVSFDAAGIFIVLNQHHRPDAWLLVEALASAPLGWFMLHTMSAFHYADLYYFESGGKDEASALIFPGTDEPEVWDFLYFSFVIGMTAQVSDVQVCTAKMRRAVGGHSIVSFFFNTVLIAMAVNAAVAAAG